jgi:beta-lactamase regulating signal transducer with metallopeptidase domain
VPLFPNSDTPESLPESSISVEPLPDYESLPEAAFLNFTPSDEVSDRPVPEAVVTESIDIPWPLLLLSVAGLGSLWLLARGWWRIRRLQRELVQSELGSPELNDRIRELALRLGLKHAPEVRVVRGHLSPMIWCPGWSSRQAKLLFPVALQDRLSPVQLDSILLHELAHLRRGDFGVRWLELLAVAFYWWFPLLSWIRRELRQHEEACCDEWVISLTHDPRSYADALVETLVFLEGSTPVPHLATGVKPIHNLQRRIRMIMSGSTVRRWTRLGVVATLSFALAAIAIGPGISETSAQEGERKERKEGEGRKGFEGKFEGKFKSFEGKKEGEKKAFEGNREEGRKEGPMKEASREEIEKARKEVEEARRQMERAMRALVEAEEKMARMEGRRFEGIRGFGGMGGFGGGPGGGFGPGGPGGPGGIGGPPRFVPKEGERKEFPPREGERKENPPREGERKENPRGGFEGPKDAPQRGLERLEQLEQQLRRLTEELENMRREMRRGGPENVPMPRKEEPKRK